MALSSLRFKPGGDSLSQAETKSGSYIYDGSVSNFHEWEFRTEMRISAALASVDSDGEPKQQPLIAAINKIVEGLRGDAFDMAMDIGKVDLLTETVSTSLYLTFAPHSSPSKPRKLRFCSRSGRDLTGRCRVRVGSQ